jgi:hypothetical protein
MLEGEVTASEQKNGGPAKAASQDFLSNYINAYKKSYILHENGLKTYPPEIDWTRN